MPGHRLLDPGSTAAVVFGAHDWTEAGLGRAPSFLRSARGVVAYLYDQAGLALNPDLVLDLFDSNAGAGEQLAEIKDALDIRLRERRAEGRPVTDLVVYYVGHGHTDDQGHLSLLVRRSRRGMETQTGIRAPDLAQVLRVAAPQQRRVIVLDCCFSEAAARGFIGMSPTLDQAVAATAAKDLGDDQPRRGTLLLCSSPVGEVSIGPPNAARTLFTGALLDVLRQGAEGKPPALSFADLRDAAYGRMVEGFGANAPRPVLHQVNAAHGDLTRTPAFPNRAPTSPAAQGGSQGSSLVPEPWRRPETASTEASAPRRSHPSSKQEFRFGPPSEKEGSEAEVVRPPQSTTQDRHLPSQEQARQPGYASLEAARAAMKVAADDAPQPSASQQQTASKTTNPTFFEMKEAGVILGIIFIVIVSVAVFAGVLALLVGAFRSAGLN